MYTYRYILYKTDSKSVNCNKLYRLYNVCANVCILKHVLCLIMHYTNYTHSETRWLFEIFEYMVYTIKLQELVIIKLLVDTQFNLDL